MMAGPLLLTWAFALLVSAPDTSGPSQKCAGEDRDAQGRLIRKVGKDGFTRFYTYDPAGRIVRIEMGQSGVTPKASWVHAFIYEGQKLKAEVDCLGIERSFCDSPRIDIKKGTALPRHRHPQGRDFENSLLRLPVFPLSKPHENTRKARKP